MKKFFLFAVVLTSFQWCLGNSNVTPSNQQCSNDGNNVVTFSCCTYGNIGYWVQYAGDLGDDANGQADCNVMYCGQTQLYFPDSGSDQQGCTVGSGTALMNATTAAPSSTTPLCEISNYYLSQGYTCESI